MKPYKPKPEGPLNQVFYEGFRWFGGSRPIIERDNMKLYKHNQTGDQLYCLAESEAPGLPGLPRWQKVNHYHGKFYPEGMPFLMCIDGFVECPMPSIDYKAAFDKQLMISRMLLITNVISFIVTIVVMVIAYNK